MRLVNCVGEGSGSIGLIYVALQVDAVAFDFKNKGDNHPVKSNSETAFLYYPWLRPVIQSSTLASIGDEP